MEQLYDNVENAVRVLFEHEALARILLREAVAIGGEVGERIAQLDSYMNAMLVGALTKGATAGWRSNRCRWSSPSMIRSRFRP